MSVDLKYEVFKLSVLADGIPIFRYKRRRVIHIIGMGTSSPNCGGTAKQKRIMLNVLKLANFDGYKICDTCFQIEYANYLAHNGPEECTLDF